MDRWNERLQEITALVDDQKPLKDALKAFARKFRFSQYTFFNYSPSSHHTIFVHENGWQDRLLPPAVGGRPPGNASPPSSFSKSLVKIGCGSSISVTTQSGASSVLTYESSTARFSEETVDAEIAVTALTQLHDRLEKLQPRQMTLRMYLSPKESVFVRWLENGQTVGEIAELENLKYNAVRIVLEEARLRYNLRNNAQLLALAIRNGLI